MSLSQPHRLALFFRNSQILIPSQMNHTYDQRDSDALSEYFLPIKTTVSSSDTLLLSSKQPGPGKEIELPTVEKRTNEEHVQNDALFGREESHALTIQDRPSERYPSSGPFSSFYKPGRNASELSNNPFLQLATMGMNNYESENDLKQQKSLSINSDTSNDSTENASDCKEIKKEIISRVRAGSIEDRVQKTFELPPEEKLIGEFACWLIRSVLLKGYAYVTEHNLCFYASLPAAESSVIKSGFLKQRTYSRPRAVYTTYWFSLKSHAFISYNSSTVTNHF